MAEGDASTVPARLVLTLSAPAAGDVTLRAATADGSARAREDYITLDAQVTIPAGETSAIVDVPVLGDTTPEPDKSLTLNLSEVTGATLGDARSAYTATILDDDVAPPPLTVGVDDVPVAEPDGDPRDATFSVTLNRPSDAPVTVRYVTLDNTAVAPQDYLAVAGLLTFSPGETGKTVGVRVVGGTVPEPTEYFGLLLKAPTGASIAKAVGVGIISDADVARASVPAAPKLALSPAPQRDGAPPSPSASGDG